MCIRDRYTSASCLPLSTDFDLLYDFLYCKVGKLLRKILFSELFIIKIFDVWFCCDRISFCKLHCIPAVSGAYLCSVCQFVCTVLGSSSSNHLWRPFRAPEMAENSTSVPLPESLRTVLGTCGSAPVSTPLPRDSDSNSIGSYSERDVHMDSDGSGDCLLYTSRCV